MWVSNTLIGSVVFPFLWAVTLETAAVPIAIDVLFFAVVGPALAALLFSIANVEDGVGAV